MNIKNLFKLWKKAIVLETMAHLAYPISLFFFAVSSILFSIGGPILAMIVYSSGAGIPGWTFYEFLLFNGTMIFFNGMLLTLFSAQVYRIPHDIEKGKFDMYLLRPVHLAIYILATGFDLDGIGNVFLGSILIVYSIIAGAIHVTIISFISYLFLLTMGMVVSFCIVLLIVALSLLFVKVEVIWSIMDTLFEFMRYPMNIYSGFIQFAFTFIIPIALASFYPVEALLGNINVSTFIVLAGSVLVFASVSMILLKLALKKYTSAGG